MNELSDTIYETKITTDTASPLRGAIPDGYEPLALCARGGYDGHYYHDDYYNYHNYHNGCYTLPVALPIARVSLRVEQVV